ncbi:MAG: hypothetical protein LBH43_15545 [Treponema sp.]|jgi:hypothetical protein|nr:hypothetical protein [Treponema sp.]
MKKLIVCLTIIFVFVCFACELEGAAVIGPGRGMVFYDQGMYENGWRFLECTPETLKEYDERPDNATVSKIIAEYNQKSDKKKDWRLPTADEAEKIKKAYVTLSFQHIVNSDNKYLGKKSKYIIRAVRQF